MNLRGIHIVIFVVVVAAGLVIYGAVRSPVESPATTGPSEPQAPTPQQPAPTDASAEPKPPAHKPAVIASLKPKTSVPGGGPVLVVTPAKLLDVGLIPGEGMTNRTVKLANTGDTVLEIAKILSKCGCVKATIKPEDMKIPPGGESSVNVAVNPKAIHGFETRKSFTIVSNDAANPNLKIEVTAKVDPEFEVMPAKIEFGDVRKGGTPEKTMIFRQLTEERVVLKEVKARTRGTGGVELSVAERPRNQWLRPDRTEYTITARLREDVSPGALSAGFALHLNCKRLRTFNSTVTANVKAFYNIVPTTSPMLRNYPTTGGKNTTQVIVSGDRPFEILDLASSNPDLLVTRKLAERENSHILVLELKEDAKPGRSNDAITFLIKSNEETLKERITVRTYAASAAQRARAAQRIPRRSPVKLHPGATPGAKPVAPTAARPVAPTTPKPVAPTVARPAAPAVPKPVAPTVAKPAAPTVARPTAPTAAKPTAEAVPEPAAPATATNPPTAVEVSEQPPTTAQ